MTIESPPVTRRSRVPDLFVEQLLLGELPSDVAARVRAELEAQPDGLERLQSLRRSNDELLLRFPPRSVVPRLERDLGIRRRRSTFFVILPAFAAGAAAVALAFHGGHTQTISDIPNPEVTTIKGEAHLSVYRKNLKDAPRLKSGSIVHPHDLLQVRYSAGPAKYGVIFSIDGRGQLTQHYPDQSTKAQPLDPKNEVTLDHAFELDDAPGFERFFFVTAKTPFDADAVLKDATALAGHPDAADQSLKLPAGVSQYSILLRKETP